MGARLVGAQVQRLEDPRLITGKGRYVDDMVLPGMAQAAFVRSTHAHARILSIDTAAARAMPGVHAVLTLSDLGPAVARDRMPQTAPSPAIRRSVTQYVLARDEVCYVGEAVVMVIADTRHQAEDAAARVLIDYDVLPAVVDCRKALDGTATAHHGAADNLAARLSVGFGDIDAAFQSAPHRVTLALDQHRGVAHSMEGRAVLATQDAVSGKLTVWSATQSPYMVRRFLA
ncbi:MAG TPA: molybdopterin cofactor-binding domain-containing protein, partial [Paracoccaceae bacterium]|nr:molybdopterin cofactor-binding domain-containing protein [Paracoccaceae bacterium]